MKKSIRDIGYIPITENEGAINYGDIVYFSTTEAGGREYTADPRGELIKIYANGVLAYAEDNNRGYDISLTLLDIIDDVEENWYGKTLITDGLKGVAEYANSGKLPKFALIIHEDTTDGAGKISFYPYCHISNRMSKKGKTKEEGAFDFAYADHKIEAEPRPTDMLACYEFPGKAKLTAPPEPKKPTQTQTTSDNG